MIHLTKVSNVPMLRIGANAAGAEDTLPKAAHRRADGEWKVRGSIHMSAILKLCECLQDL
jgi:hypothetical protein